MTLFQTLQEDYKQAFKSRDAIGKAALSYVLAQLKNKKIDLWREPDDEEIMKVIHKEVKILKETAEGFKTQGYIQQYEEEMEKVEVLSKYLPTMLNESELLDIINAKQQELEIQNEDLTKNKWRLIGTIMKQYGATVDGGMLNRLISEKSS